MKKKILSAILAMSSIALVVTGYSIRNLMPIWLYNNWSLVAVFFAASSFVLAINFKMLSFFVSESYIELIKVHWPSKDEVMRYTIITLLVLFTASLFIWFLDGILIKLIAFVTGQIG
jgi:preprotein translocase subunit SecE